VLAELVEERGAVVGMRRKGGHQLRGIFADLSEGVDGRGVCGCCRCARLGCGCLFATAGATDGAVGTVLLEAVLAAQTNSLGPDGPKRTGEQITRSEGAGHGQAFSVQHAEADACPTSPARRGRDMAGLLFRP
jgi:hypothetical protein